MDKAEQDRLWEQDVQQVKRHVEQLLEHFDTVQIFVTRHMPAELDGTRMVSTGGGNWFARYGYCKEWLIKEDEQARQQCRPRDE